MLVKLAFTTLTLALMVLAGRRYYPVCADVPLVSFGLALLSTTPLCVASLGFVTASLAPTTRFAQPLGTLVLYPLLGLSGLFVPVAAMPDPLQGVAWALPLTYAVSLLRGIWHGEGWLAYAGDVVVLGAVLLASTLVSARMFRWE